MTPSDQATTRMRIRVKPTEPKQQHHHSVEGLKGLENKAAANHCFLNVCLQGCLHLKGVREVVLETAHTCEGEGCLLCEVRHVVQSAPRVSASYLSPVLVRKALYAKVGGDVAPMRMADAVEVFTLLFEEIRRMVPKSAFSGVMPDTTYMLNAKKCCEIGDVTSSVVSPPSHHPHCLYPIQVVWKNYPVNSIEMQVDLAKFAEVLTSPLRVHEVSPNLYPPDEPPARLRGFISYYALHYTAVFRLETNTWVHFDDTLISPISANWADVANFIMRGRHMPVLLFYERDLEEGWVDVTTPKYEEADVEEGCGGGVAVEEEGKCIVA